MLKRQFNPDPSGDTCFFRGQFHICRERKLTPSGYHLLKSDLDSYNLQVLVYPISQVITFVLCGALS